MLLDMDAVRLNPEDTNGSFNLLNRWLVSLVDGINNCLCNIEEGNMNDSFVQTLKATKVVAETVISNTVITQNLYAEYGDIAELTVDRLVTANKVARYQAKDQTEVNYIWIQDQSMKMVTGTTDGTSVQHRDRNGQLLYWKDADKKAMGTEPTQSPVMIYKYTELCKAEFSFVMDTDSGYYTPQIALGAGIGQGDRGKAFIWKTKDGLKLKYVTEAGNETTISLGDYVDSKSRRIQSVAIDKASETVTVQMEGVQSPVTLNYTESADSMTFTWPDGHSAKVSIR